VNLFPSSFLDMLRFAGLNAFEFAFAMIENLGMLLNLFQYLVIEFLDCMTRKSL
jgi:hypothetical protein